MNYNNQCLHIWLVSFLKTQVNTGFGREKLQNLKWLVMQWCTLSFQNCSTLGHFDMFPHGLKAGLKDSILFRFVYSTWQSGEQRWWCYQHKQMCWGLIGAMQSQKSWVGWKSYVSHWLKLMINPELAAHLSPLRENKKIHKKVLFPPHCSTVLHITINNTKTKINTSYPWIRLLFIRNRKPVKFNM